MIIIIIIIIIMNLFANNLSYIGREAEILYGKK